MRYGPFAIIVGDGAAVSQASREQTRGQQQSGKEFHGSILECTCGHCAAFRPGAREESRKRMSQIVLHPAGSPHAFAGENPISLTLCFEAGDQQTLADLGRQVAPAGNSIR